MNPSLAQVLDLPRREWEGAQCFWEKQAPRREPDVGLDPGTLGSGPELKLKVGHPID